MRIIAFGMTLLVIAGTAQSARAQSTAGQIRMRRTPLSPRATSAASLDFDKSGFFDLTAARASEKGRPTVDSASAPQVWANPWVGAQAGYVFGGGEFASNLIANGSLTYAIMEKAITRGGHNWLFALPVRGNVSALVAAKDDASRDKATQALLSGAQGIRVSVEPSIDLEPRAFLRTQLISSLGWKLNAAKDSRDSTVYLALGRFSAGVSFAIGPTEAGSTTLPIVLELSPVYSAFASREYQKVNGLERSMWSGEMTLVVPLSEGMGFLTEAIVGQRALPSWRMGMVLLAPK